jgi:hypothetical protein
LRIVRYEIHQRTADDRVMPLMTARKFMGSASKPDRRIGLKTSRRTPYVVL